MIFYDFVPICTNLYKFVQIWKESIDGWMALLGTFGQLESRECLEALELELADPLLKQLYRYMYIYIYMYINPINLINPINPMNPISPSVVSLMG